MRYSRKHIADQPLLQRLCASASTAHAATADFLADLAEVDLHRLYLAQGFPSMFAYCVSRVRLSEDAAYRHIEVARVARQFPEIFPAIADRRLSMTVVLMLAPRLTEATAHELLAASTHKTKAQTAELLAQRYPRPDVPTRLRALPAARPPEPPRTCELAPERVELERASTEQLALERAVVAPHTLTLVEGQLAPERVESTTPAAPTPRSKIHPLAPRRLALQVTIDEETRDLLRLRPRVRRKAGAVPGSRAAAAARVERWLEDPRLPRLAATTPRARAPAPPDPRHDGAAR